MATKQKKKMNTATKLLLLFLILLLLGIGVYSIYVYIYNHTEREYHSNEQSHIMDISIVPRGGQTDSWIKRVDDHTGHHEYTGTIYNIVINNISDSTILQWNMKININSDCYINNAWCGCVEIHQNVNEKERVQVVDLRDYNESELTLEHSVMKPDLMIPLHKGDYIIYHPDRAASEFPIAANIDGHISQAIVGIVFYTAGTASLDFNDYSMTYSLKFNYFHNPVFLSLSIAFLIWIILLAIYLSVQLNTRKMQKRFRQDEQLLRQSIGVFTQFFEAKDTYTNGHSQRVAEYAQLLAEKLGYNDEKCRQAYCIALMHDCGKCYISDEILKKPDKLTDEEYDIVKKHPAKGAEMLKDFTAIKNISEGVLYHHERYDGKGYPEGLKGEKIPIISRIICIADSFDAMNSRRCYRDKLSREKIISEIKENSGKQFDPVLVTLFMQLIEEGKIEV
ncbi:MAG: HD-GYP domain-containing protein [Clostridia bacterium]|nr:HD-GYP domain-containing protein [Clostridia bacterium]